MVGLASTRLGSDASVIWLGIAWALKKPNNMIVRCSLSSADQLGRPTTRTIIDV